MLVDKIEVAAYWELHPKEGILVDILPDKKENKSMILLSLSNEQAEKLIADLQTRLKYMKTMDETLEKDSKTW